MKKEATPKIIQDPSYRRFGCHVNIDEIAHLCYMERYLLVGELLN